MTLQSDSSRIFHKHDFCTTNIEISFQPQPATFIHNHFRRPFVILNYIMSGHINRYCDQVVIIPASYFGDPWLKFWLVY